ncbi:OLC1v1037773C1 [Oldenlandia corymbosa var. corymbosa]|uniref:OLC1v1037773C1 n=1 Tax=Oldenlandia corymbosa var. corymbosa TaxID=529605 RepID=A0AAV1CZI1_OLDCO|nr:OLC1v1037773C1 [Oldenlandia corymbosa var. corymbosa]
MATGSSRPDPSFKPSGRSLIPAAKDLKAIEAAITSSEPLIKRVDFDDEGDDLKCPVLDYYPHVVNGGFVMNPKSIKPFPPSFEDDSFREEKGLPALGIHHRDGVLFAVNHAQPDLCDTAVTYPRLGLVATISGGKVDDCSQLLGELKTKVSPFLNLLLS